MTTRVQGPDGAIVEFPDGTSPDVMQSAMRAHYGAPAIAAATERMPDVTVTPSLFEKINNFGNDLGDATMHHLANIPVGLGQLAAHGLKGLVDAGSPAPEQTLSSLITGQQAPPAQHDGWLGKLESLRDSMRGAVDNGVASLDQGVKNREASYQASVPDNTASYLGATIGEVTPWLTGLGELRAAGAIPQATKLAGKLGSLAVEGGVMGAAQPVTSDGSYGSGKALQVFGGAATGPVLHGLGSLASGIGGGVRDIAQHITNPQAIADKHVLGMFGSAPETLAKLRTAPEYVPGEAPSAGQAIATPDAVAAERVLRNNPDAKLPFVAQDNANNAVRQDIVEKLAGTEADMEAAKVARRAAVQPYIDANLTDSSPMNRWAAASQPFDAALSKPMVRGDDFRALQEAKGVIAKVKSGAMQEDDALEAMKELGDSVSQKYAPVFQQAMDAINKNMVNPVGVLKALATTRNSAIGLNRINQGGSSTTVADALDKLAASIKERSNINGLIGTDQLNGVQKEAAAILGNATPAGAVGLGPAKNTIVDAIDRVAPGYRDYLAAYAQHSEPINTMESVGKLVDPNAPGSLNTASDPQLAISRLRQVLRGDDKAKYPMSDAAREQLDQVRDSLLRRTISDNPMAASGPATAADLQAAGGTKLGSLLFGNPLSGKPGPLARMVGTAGGGGIGALLGGGPIGAITGASFGSLLPEGVGKVNAGIANRIGATASDSNATADAILRALGTQKDAGKVSGALQRLLYGTEQGAAPQAKLAQARMEWDNAMRQARLATPAMQNVPESVWKGAAQRIAQKYGVTPELMLGSP